MAKKRPRGGGVGFVNSLKKLQRMEICSKRDCAFCISDAQERFRNIHLQVPVFSTYGGSSSDVGTSIAVAYRSPPVAETSSTDTSNRDGQSIPDLRSRITGISCNWHGCMYSGVAAGVAGGAVAGPGAAVPAVVDGSAAGVFDLTSFGAKPDGEICGVYEK